MKVISRALLTLSSTAGASCIFRSFGMIGIAPGSNFPFFRSRHLNDKE